MPRILPLSIALTLAMATFALAQEAAAPSSGDANPQAAAAEEAAERTMRDGTVMRREDLQRLNNLDRSLGLGLHQALSQGATEDIAALVQAMAGAALPPDQAQPMLAGDWSCQTMKLGHNLPLVIYAPFACHITADGRFDKLSGSQRTTGKIQEQEGRLIYLGTAFVSGEAPRAYADWSDDYDASLQGLQAPEVGVVEMTGKTSGRIILPAPYVESAVNVLVLRR